MGTYEFLVKIRDREGEWTEADVSTALKHMYVRAKDRGVEFEVINAKDIPVQQTLDLPV